ARPAADRHGPGPRGGRAAKPQAARGPPAGGRPSGRIPRRGCCGAGEAPSETADGGRRSRASPKELDGPESCHTLASRAPRRAERSEAVRCRTGTHRGTPRTKQELSDAVFTREAILTASAAP